MTKTKEIIDLSAQMQRLIETVAVHLSHSNPFFVCSNVTVTVKYVVTKELTVTSKSQQSLIVSSVVTIKYEYRFRFL